MNKLISKKCVDLVKSFEGFRPTIYKDIVGVLTLGYGFTGSLIKGLTTITEPQASAMLENILNEKYATPIKIDLDKRKVKLNQNEFDALVSMTYNIGIGGMLGSTLYKNICAGIRDMHIITDNFCAWDKAGGKVVPGLLRRRREEAALFFDKNGLVPPTLQPKPQPPVPTKRIQITADNTIIRKTYLPNSPILDKAKIGNQYNSTKIINGNWYEIVYSGGLAYISIKSAKVI